MSKIAHDTIVATERPVNFDKPYFHKAISYLKTSGKGKLKILDLGAGNGEFGVLVKKAFGAEVTCLDYANPHLETLRRLGFETIKMDFDNNDEVESVAKKFQEKFDVVTAFEFIEHIFGVDDFLNFAYRVLKPGGKIIISTPNLDYSFFHLYSFFLGNIPVGEGHHVRFFNRHRLTQALVLDGFDFEQELSHGRGTANWDRIVGERGKFFEYLIRGLGRLIYTLTPGFSSKKYRKLMLVGRKTDVKPLGMDMSWRDPHYKSLTLDERRKVFSRLIEFRKKKLFSDMPLFRKFFDEECMKYLNY